MLLCKGTPQDIHSVNTVVFLLEIRISYINYVFTHSTFNLYTMYTRIWIFQFYYEKNCTYIL